MSEGDPNNGAELVPVERGLAPTSLADKRIVSEMVADWLAVARDSALTSVDFDALVRRAKKLYRSKGDGMTEENIRAFKLFLRAAEAGHSDAQYHLCWCYISGQGVPEDYVEGTKWHRKAAEQGHAKGQAFLAYRYQWGYGCKKTMGKLRVVRKLQRGDAHAQNYLGYICQLGYGVPQDYAEEVKWHREAAEQGTHLRKTILVYAIITAKASPKIM